MQLSQTLKDRRPKKEALDRSSIVRSSNAKIDLESTVKVPEVNKVQNSRLGEILFLLISFELRKLAT